MKTGNFFAVDRHAWARVCDLGVNQAICFLVMARGTGGDNRTTSWSVNAVEERTSISRPRAKLAVQSLVQKKLVELLVGGTRPRYKLAIGSPQAKCAKQKAEAEWLWLPNALVDGLRDETPPIELLRQSNSIDAVRMFANLYADHDIRDDAGLPWRDNEGISNVYEREEVNRRGEYVIWGFSKIGMRNASATMLAAKQHHASRGSWDGFWDALHVLTDIGLVQYVAHLVHARDEQGEVFHPLPIQGEGEPAEVRITAAAVRAAEAMVPPEQETWKFWAMVPVKRHMRDVQLVDIARLRYRPQTSATASWTAKAAEWDRWADAYTNMGNKALGTTSHLRSVATSRQDQGIIKV